MVLLLSQFFIHRGLAEISIFVEPSPNSVGKRALRIETEWATLPALADFPRHAGGLLAPVICGANGHDTSR